MSDDLVTVRTERISRRYITRRASVRTLSENTTFLRENNKFVIIYINYAGAQVTETRALSRCLRTFRSLFPAACRPRATYARNSTYLSESKSTLLKRTTSNRASRGFLITRPTRTPKHSSRSRFTLPASGVTFVYFHHVLA